MPHDSSRTGNFSSFHSEREVPSPRLPAPNAILAHGARYLLSPTGSSVQHPQDHVSTGFTSGQRIGLQMEVGIVSGPMRRERTSKASARTRHYLPPDLIRHEHRSIMSTTSRADLLRHLR